MNTLMSPGQNATMDITRADGAVLLTVLISLFTDGVSMTFTNHPLLDRTFTNLDQGRAYLRFLKAEAAAGTELWLIIEQAGMWTSAAAVADQAEQDLIDSINATMDAAQAGYAAEQDAERADVAEIVGDGQGFNRMRHAYRPVRNTRTKVHLKNLNDRQTAAARRHRNGVVHLGNGVTRPMLRAMADKGFGTLNYQPGLGRRRVIESLTLSTAGYAVAQQVGAVA